MSFQFTKYLKIPKGKQEAITRRIYIIKWSPKNEQKDETMSHKAQNRIWSLVLSSLGPLVTPYVFNKSNTAAKNILISYERGIENGILTTANGKDRLSSVTQIFRKIQYYLHGQYLRSFCTLRNKIKISRIPLNVSPLIGVIKRNFRWGQCTFVNDSRYNFIHH
jgi:hypothetical protein